MRLEGRLVVVALGGMDNIVRSNVLDLICARGWISRSESSEMRDLLQSCFFLKLRGIYRMR